ncbi:unnamed protein product, partial [Brassica oleracea]
RYLLISSSTKALRISNPQSPPPSLLRSVFTGVTTTTATLVITTTGHLYFIVSMKVMPMIVASIICVFCTLPAAFSFHLLKHLGASAQRWIASVTELCNGDRGQDVMSVTVCNSQT